MNILSNIFLGISPFIFFDSMYRYYNLKYYNKYYDYNIQNKNVTHIEIYKKNKEHKEKKFLYDKCYSLLNSLSIIDDKKFYNIKYYNPTFYLYYKNDFVIHTKFNFLSYIKSNNFIKYKIIENKNSFCLYNKENLLLISSDRESLIKYDLDKNLSYFYLCIILSLFFYKLNKINTN